MFPINANGIFFIPHGSTSKHAIKMKCISVSHKCPIKSLIGEFKKNNDILNCIVQWKIDTGDMWYDHSYKHMKSYRKPRSMNLEA